MLPACFVPDNLLSNKGCSTIMVRENVRKKLKQKGRKKLKEKGRKKLKEKGQLIAIVSHCLHAISEWRSDLRLVSLLREGAEAEEPNEAEHESPEVEACLNCITWHDFSL